MAKGGLYRVYNHFVRVEDVFADPEEAGEFSELLREVKLRDGLTIYARALLWATGSRSVGTGTYPCGGAGSELRTRKATDEGASVTDLGT